MKTPLYAIAPGVNDRFLDWNWWSAWLRFSLSASHAAVWANRTMNALPKNISVDYGRRYIVLAE